MKELSSLHAAQPLGGRTWRKQGISTRPPAGRRCTAGCRRGSPSSMAPSAAAAPSSPRMVRSRVVSTLHHAPHFVHRMRSAGLAILAALLRGDDGRIAWISGCMVLKILAVPTLEHIHVVCCSLLPYLLGKLVVETEMSCTAKTLGPFRHRLHRAAIRAGTGGDDRGGAAGGTAGGRGARESAPFSRVAGVCQLSRRDHGLRCHRRAAVAGVASKEMWRKPVTAAVFESSAACCCPPDVPLKCCKVIENVGSILAAWLVLPQCLAFSELWFAELSRVASSSAWLL